MAGFTSQPLRAILSFVCAVSLVIVGADQIARRTANAQNASSSQPQTEAERRRFEIVEDLSESLANDLLELSVATCARDAQATLEFLPAQLSATPFPSRPLPVVNQIRWIGTRAWSVPMADATGRTTNASVPSGANRVDSTSSGTEPGAPNANAVPRTPGNSSSATSNNPTSNNQFPPARQMTREEFMRGWMEFLSNFAEIEDARFKVKESSFDDTASAVLGADVPTAVVGSTGRARVAFYVIGRNRAGQREWARGVANVAARFAETRRWQFDSFSLVSLDSMVASADLFSEVAIPANVSASRPAYGTNGNTGFVWHGATAADFDRDGWIDLFVTSPDRNFLYLNDRRGRFRDASQEAGVGSLASGTAPLALDYDNDGDSDLFISAVGAQVMMENRLVPDGRLEFRDVSQEAGVGGAQAIGFSATSGDVNNDGRPDIYVTSYNRYGQVTPNSWFRATNGTPSLLFINQGGGRFREEARRWGVENNRWGYAAQFADINSDGRLDLFVANDFGEKALYINNGERFTDEAERRGVLDPGNGMGVSFGDYNNDGRLDLHTTNMSSTAGNRIISRLFPNSTAGNNVYRKLAAGNNLFENTGDGQFRDVTEQVGGFSGGWAWGGGFIDFDNDGWQDLFTPNGFISGRSMKDT
jgi:hypothetical protein